MLYLAATLTDAKYDLTYVFYDHEEVAAEKNGLRKVVEAHPDWISGDFAIIGERPIAVLKAAAMARCVST